MIDDYDDEDTHICLKCHLTIIGLDNYVSHRKAGCTKIIPNIEISKSPSRLLGSDEGVPSKANDFFLSLELQSSAKKSSPSDKSSNRLITRSRKAISLTNKDNEVTKNDKAIWIYGQDVCDNEASLLKTVDTPTKKYEASKMRDDDDSDDYMYDDDDSEEDYEAPPDTHTGGKWKPSSSPVYWTANRDHRDWNIPPPNFTGGKWNPSTNKLTRISHSPPPNHTKGKWKPSPPLSPPRDNSDIPPPTFTGSKWTASKAVTKLEFSNVPPPEHTKGKWKPQITDEWNHDSKPKWKSVNKGKETKTSQISINSPFRKSNGTVQYWCGPCNRHLASKIVYERHLKSDLHHKRILKDRDFDESNVLENSEKKRKVVKRLWTKLKSTKTKDNVKKRKRKTIYVKCDVCRSRVHKHFMGKHLISHYHCRKGDITSAASHQMVLDNIHDIVLQSPYQCSPCRFFCNIQSEFLKHWLSEEHLKIISLYNGYLNCSYCKYQTENNDDMYKHLISTEHCEVISVINRSVPIIVTKIQTVSCATCAQSFEFNIQLIKHCEKEAHSFCGTASDSYQNKFACNCEKIFRSQIALQRHQRREHKESVYVCRICNITFYNINDSKMHRRTCEHRYAANNDKTNQEGKNFSKTCEYCNETLENILEFKIHVKSNHPEYAHM